MDYEHTPPIRRITVTRLKLPEREVVITRQEAMTLCHDLFLATDETQP